MDYRSWRSRFIYVTFLLLVNSITFCTAASPLFLSRQAKIKVAFVRASDIAVSRPIPVLDPVIITICPVNDYFILQTPP